MLFRYALNSTSPPWFFFQKGKERDIENHLGELSSDTDINVRIIRGRRCRTRRSLFQEFAAALQFPWYFGENWDAFDECLGDLAWLKARPLVLLITQLDLLLSECPQEFPIFVTSLLGAAHWHNTGKERNDDGQDWGGEEPTPFPFHVVFHCEQNEEHLLAALATCGIDPVQE